MTEVLEFLFSLWALCCVVVMLFSLMILFLVELMPKEKKPIRSYIIEEDEFDDWRSIEAGLDNHPPQIQSTQKKISKHDM